jgi:hypothetical protein
MTEEVVPPAIEIEEIPQKFAGITDRRLPARDRAVAGFAIAVLVLVAGVCIFVAVECYMPPLSLSKVPAADQKEAIANFKELSGILMERGEKIFDVMLSKGLLPVFATLIGFLLGQGGKREQ